MGIPSANQLAEICFQQFNALPKTGKPTTNQWTVLSAILQHNSNENQTKVVALSCGTKCIGQSKLCARGLVLNDSHAEVLARRAFMRYLYHKLVRVIAIKDSQTESDDTFEWNTERLVMRLKSGISFHFVSTQSPCGDACIDETTEAPTAKRVKLDDTVRDVDFICTALDSNLQDETEIVFTGAKLIGDQHSDAMQQTVGAVRTKPGRGDRTLSMSCSDKLARWNVLGVQGALLDMLLDTPIYLQTLNFCCSCNMTNLKRAIYERFNANNLSKLSSRFQSQKPEIRVCSNDMRWEYAQQPQQEQQQPSPNGLVWCEIDSHTLLIHKFYNNMSNNPKHHNFLLHCRPYEVCVDGKRQGITKKKLQTSQAALQISKYQLFKSFIELLEDWEPKLLQKFSLNIEQLKLITYGEFKQLSKDYQSAWAHAKRDYFRQWTQKSHSLLMFCVDSAES